MHSFVLFTLTAKFPSLLPPRCPPGASSKCEPPNATQATVLYTAVCLLAVGNGGTRYNTATMGADQFDNGGGEERRHLDAFFSWYFVLLYASYMVWRHGAGLRAGHRELGLGLRRLRRDHCAGPGRVARSVAVSPATRSESQRWSWSRLEERNVTMDPLVRLRHQLNHKIMELRVKDLSRQRK